MWSLKRGKFFYVYESTIAISMVATMCSGISHAATNWSAGDYSISGTIAGDVLNASANDLIINGASSHELGVLTGSGGGISSADVGTITNVNSDIKFNFGRLLLNDTVIVDGHKVINAGASLQINNIIFIEGEYIQLQDAALTFGVADTAVATGDILIDSDHGTLMAFRVSLAPGSSIGLSNTGNGYAYAQGQRFAVIAAMDGANTNFNERSLNYILNATGLTLTGENVPIAGGSGVALVLTVVGKGSNSILRGPINSATNRIGRSSLDGLFQYKGMDAQLMNLFNASAALGNDGNQGGAQLSPGTLASAASAASISTTGRVFNILSAHMDNVRATRVGNTGLSSIADGKGLWSQAFSGNSHQRERDDISGYDAFYQGLLVGGDGALNENWNAGILISNTKTMVKINGNNQRSSADIDSYGMIGYAAYTGDFWYLNLSAGAVQQKYDIERQIKLPGFNGAPQGGYDGIQYVSAAQLGYPVELGSQTYLTPKAGLLYSLLKQNRYTEHGGNGAALKVISDDTHSLKSNLGAKLEQFYAYNYGEIIPFAQLTWRHEFRDKGLRTVANYAADVSGETRFNANGPSAITDFAELSLGVAISRNSQVTVSAEYTLEAGNGFTSSTGNLKVVSEF